MTLASRGADAIKIWNLANGEEIQSFPSDGANFGTVAYSPSESRLATEKLGTGITTLELNNRSEPVHFRFPPEAKADPNLELTRGWGLAYAPDGSFLVAAGVHQPDQGYVAIWETATAQVSEFPSLGRPITTVACSPDGRTIASGSMDGKIVFWDRETRKQRLAINAGRSYLAPVVFSPDGQFIASADESRWVRFWDVKTGKSVASLKGHIKAILSLAFHPDGKTLVSGDSGGTLFVWNVPSRSMMTRLESGERGKVWTLAFSPDGKVLAAGSEDKLVHLWDITETAPAGK